VERRGYGANDRLYSPLSLFSFSVVRLAAGNRRQEKKESLNLCTELEGLSIPYSMAAETEAHVLFV
jgi:hypothetical protein